MGWPLYLDIMCTISLKPAILASTFHSKLRSLLSFDANNAGYVAVLGKPNVGKSTLSNQMIGQKISIVTDKAQTTRHRILGLCSAPEYQVGNFLRKMCWWLIVCCSLYTWLALILQQSNNIEEKIGAQLCRVNTKWQVCSSGEYCFLRQKERAH